MIEHLTAQYLYRDYDLYILMDSVEFIQIAVTAVQLGDKVDLMKEGIEGIAIVRSLGMVIDIQFPALVQLMVIECESDEQCQNDSDVRQRVRLETGAFFYVPVYVKAGEIVTIDTRLRKVI